MDGLSLNGVTVERGAFRLQADLCLDRPLTAVLGPSGAGKSTLLSLFAGFLRPDQGTVHLGDTPLAGDGHWVPPHRRRIGVLFQEPRLWPHLTVAKTIRYGGRHREDDVIAWCGLEHLLHRRPAGLSGGEAQRVAIARAVMADPQWLLLDEPFAGLDPARRAGLRTLLRTLQAETALPMVLVTHHIEEAQGLTRDLVLVDEGRVVAKGDLSDVLATPAACALSGTLGLENLLTVRVGGLTEDGLVRARLGEAALLLPPASVTPGAETRVAIAPADLMLATREITGLSARNALQGRVSALTPLPDRLLVHLDVGQPLRIEITRGAAADLGLRPGVTAWAYAKTWAFRWRQ